MGGWRRLPPRPRHLTRVPHNNIAAICFYRRLSFFTAIGASTHPGITPVEYSQVLQPWQSSKRTGTRESSPWTRTRIPTWRTSREQARPNEVPARQAQAQAQAQAQSTVRRVPQGRGPFLDVHFAEGHDDHHTPQPRAACAGVVAVAGRSVWRWEFLTTRGVVAGCFPCWPGFSLASAC